MAQKNFTDRIDCTHETCPDTLGNPNKTPGRHTMKYLYTYVINWKSGYICNILKCMGCGKQAQKSTMYEKEALSGLDLTFRDNTNHHHI